MKKLSRNHPFLALGAPLLTSVLACGTGAANSDTLPTSGGSSAATSSPTEDATALATSTSVTSGATEGHSVTGFDPSESSSTDAIMDATTGLITGTSTTETSGTQETSASSGEDGAESSTGDLGTPFCGNGIKQEGEECDDGTPECNFCFKDRHVFVTSILYFGDMSYKDQPDDKKPSGKGVKRADERCKQLAAHLPNYNGYVAWLSEGVGSGKDPKTRLPAGFQGRYVNGTDVIADDWVDLVDGNIKKPIKLDEHGNSVDVKYVWTNTTPGGVAASNLTCLGWESKEEKDAFLYNYGMAGVIDVNDTELDAAWTSFEPRKCNDTARLYCFEGPPP